MMTPPAKASKANQQAHGPAQGPVSKRDELEEPSRAVRDTEAAPPEDGTAVTRKAEDREPRDRPTVDPLALALCAPVLSASPPPVVESSMRGAVLDPVVTEIVQSLTWGGDRRRGAARIELGGKRFGGASVIVVTDGDAVTLELGGPASVDVRDLGERLRERLEKRGLTVRVAIQ